MVTRYLDITGEHCPMTFVKTRLALEELESGDILEVILQEGEPLENVPRTAEEQGYCIVEIRSAGQGNHSVRIKKP